jgi:hypothetical protein
MNDSRLHQPCVVALEITADLRACCHQERRRYATSITACELRAAPAASPSDQHDHARLGLATRLGCSPDQAAFSPQSPLPVPLVLRPKSDDGLGQVLPVVEPSPRLRAYICAIQHPGLTVTSAGDSAKWQESVPGSGRAGEYAPPGAERKKVFPHSRIP